MITYRRPSAIAVALMAATVVGVPAAAATNAEPHSGGHGDRHHGAATSTVYTLDDSSHGNPEGVAADDRYFYVGATSDGTIYRGTLGDPTVHTLIPGAAGRAAIGMKVFHGRLYVAGGPTGKVFVYDLKLPSAAPLTFDTGNGGFLNDLVVTGRGDVTVTDSFRPTLWRITADQVRAGGTVGAIPVSPEIPYTAGLFNLNGIVALHGGRELVVVHTSNGHLYRVTLGGAAGQKITTVDAPALVGGDGMLVDGGRLLVVRGNPASLTTLRLSRHETAARVDSVRTDPTLRGPSTIGRLHDRYLVVNADFATSTQPFTVAGLARHCH